MRNGGLFESIPVAASDLPRFVFVYGTLKRGHGNHVLLKDCTFMGRATTQPGEFTMISLGGFPGIIPAEKVGGVANPERVVSGEIFEVTDSDDLRHLDALEGHPNWYRRTPITVTHEQGHPVVVDTYVYLAARGSEQVILSGEWQAPRRLAIA